MKVRAAWEFDVDISDLDPKYVDVPGLAKELTKNELIHCLANKELTGDDFEYEVVEEQYMPENNLPYTHNEKLNAVVTDLMNDWNSLVEKAKSYGMDILFAPWCTETLELYFHDDHPDMLLVDKDVSCKLKGE